MDTARKEHLLERFRAYLDELPDADPTAEENRHTNLYSLFAELVALKNEVKLESRQVKTVLEEFRAVFETLQASQSQLGGELDHARNALPEQRRAALKPILLELLDLHDRLEAGLRALQNYRPSPLSRLCRREQTLLQAVAQGQEISLRRLDQILNTQQVTALAARSQPLDPHTMRAAELDRRPDLANGIVTEELRKGYTWQGELLRLAEVKVNRQPEPAAGADMPRATDNPLN
ncbi:MAG: nucleotide exchange factor GrpE [Candidatus Competibacter sp.]